MTMRDSHFSQTFVRRPVLAVVISLVIGLLGLASIRFLNIAQYPESSSSVITISTPYPGANAELVRGFITVPLEQAIASADGIEFLTSTSTQNISTINARLQLNYDVNDATAQILTRINQVRNLLPEASEDPMLAVNRGENTAYMYIAFASEELSPPQINDVLVRTVAPRLESLAGVQRVQIFGAPAIAMRIWLDPERMTALNVTPSEVRAAIAANNVLAPVGDTEGPALAINLAADTNLHTVEDFERLVVREDGATLIRLVDVADVQLGAESYSSSVYFRGTPALAVAIEVVPTANPLDVIAAVRARLPAIKQQLPSDLKAAVVYDGTVFIERSIEELLISLAQALAIVTVIIYLFLGSVRAALVPAVTMPLALVGALFLMLLMGFSINLLTLLALILAIGTVVDDGIVVVENASRHVEQGTSPQDAALASARELATPIIAMNIVVLAVFLPVAFLSGVTGALFTEFAYTVAAATLISGVVALTLSPMMCARLIRREHAHNRLARAVDAGFARLARGYDHALSRALAARWPVLALGAGVLVACGFLYTNAKRELAPQEDQGFLMMLATADPNVSLDGLERWTREIGPILQGFEAIEGSFVVNGFGGSGPASNVAFAGASLLPWEERETSVMELQPQVQARLSGIAGLQIAVFTPPSLPGAGGGQAVQMVVGANEEPLAIHEVSQRLLQAARQSGKLAFIDSDLNFDRLQVTIDIDRAKAADLGIDMRQLAGDLATMLSSGYVNFFSADGRSYRVIPQAQPDARVTPQQLTRYHVRTSSGELVPLATIVRLRQTVEPRALARFEQLNAATLSGVLAPGVTLGEAVASLREVAERTLPTEYSIDWQGESRQFVQEGSALVIAFAIAVALMYLVLAAQFESFRDPAIMLVSVPMSLAGALLFFALGVVTVNIYTQIGLLALIGSIIRHGILLVEFANNVQERDGLDRVQAMQKAAAQRLRPILMTTIATLAGMVPLLFAVGPGAASRFAIGLVLGAGMAIGTVFTLFVVPVLYTVVAKDRRTPATRSTQPHAPSR
jgi:multidrug efflux pump